MIDRQAFIQQIIENPDEDGPRLVYADWLEDENESERAEFIRVQIELALPPPRGLKSTTNLFSKQGFVRREFHKWGKRSSWGQRREELRERERELRNTWSGQKQACGVLDMSNGRLWAGRIAKLTSVKDYGFCRGFLDSVECSWQAWLDSRVWEEHPIERVKITTPIISRQDSEYIWFDGMAKINKTGLIAGTSVNTFLWQMYWPHVKEWQIPLTMDQGQRLLQAFANSSSA